MNKNHYVAIMAGGIGSRFWPSSTEENPKQFLDILGTGKSLLRMTYDRFLKLVPKDNILIVTNKRYRDLCLKHLPEIEKKNILCEPSRNNTGPCVAYTALHLQAYNPDACFVVAPSDHIIAKEEAFIEKLSFALAHVEDNNAILTLGIKPTRPDTGYGYIEINGDIKEGINKVKSFKEKPDLDTAQKYIDQGNYLWNGGIFIWKARDVIQAFKKHSPSIISVLEKDKGRYGTGKEQDYIDQVYPLTPSISVDYAILEKAQNVYTIPADIGWSDLGTWSSLYDYLDKDEDNNVLNVNGSKNINVNNSLINVTDLENVVIKGLDDYIVVANGKSLLIYPKSDEQEIKEAVKNLKE